MAWLVAYVGENLPQAQISFDRFHVVALANEAMDEVRREELRVEPAAVRKARKQWDGRPHP